MYDPKDNDSGIHGEDWRGKPVDGDLDTEDDSEGFKPIPGFEGRYAASRDGFIKSLSCIVPVFRRGKIEQRKTGELIMSPDTCPRGYKRVQLGKKKYKVHRLVMMAFKNVPNAASLEVNHIDGNPSNNCLSNLEWCTASENMQHAVKTGLTKSGIDNDQSLILMHEEMGVFFSLSEAAKLIGYQKGRLHYWVHKGRNSTKFIIAA